MAPGSYQLVMMAVDGAGNHAKNRIIDFDVTRVRAEIWRSSAAR